MRLGDVDVRNYNENNYQRFLVKSVSQLFQLPKIVNDLRVKGCKKNLDKFTKNTSAEIK